ncbi:DUF6562 domain-containing protein [Bacteroides sp.]|uniref:DUF6562 domain-containing protein n=1 Tax=Bacteroides sp. TaxID=29523 RepID=UPI003AB5AC86
MEKIFIIMTSLALLLASCNRDDSHITMPPTPDLPGENHGGAVVGLNTDRVSHDKFEDTHLYGFNTAQKMILHRYYPTQKELSADLFTLESGAYTFVAVLNVGQDFTPATRADAPLSDITLSQLLSYVKQSESDYPDMLTGMINRTITQNEVMRIEIPLSDKAGAFTTTLVTVNITLPDAKFTEYQANRVRATQPYNLRGVAEFYQKGGSALVSRVKAMLTSTATEGNYTLTAELPQDEYDMTLWVDYTGSDSADDLWYNTESLQAVTIIAADQTYAAGSDTREVFYGTATVTAAGTAASVTVATERPQAKYTLVADDVERYRRLQVANPEKYVPLDELRVQIIYEGYLPDGFNAQMGKPNSAAEGYRTAPAALPPVDAADTEVAVGSDYVFVNGSESAVSVTVLVADKEGRTVSRVPGVEIAYKRNMLTIVRGDFLTAGVVSPGINISTDWEGVYEVEF